MSFLLKANEINKTFPNLHTAVKSSSIVINKGEIHVIEGKSGSGKSTFLSMLGGMEEPTTGKVYFKGTSFYDLEDNEQAVIRGKSFGFIFQSFHLIPELTVQENIMLPLHFSKVENFWNLKDLAIQLEIHHLLDKKTPFLSGGEQQRVAIARSLITYPEIIFADEPTGNLDYKTTKVIVDLLTNLNKIHNIALVIITHEKNLINVPHHLYTMENGHLKLEEPHV